MQLLQSWLGDHPDDLYPTLDQKNELAAQTGLATKQVSDWFGRLRKKKKKKSMETLVLTDAGTTSFLGESFESDIELASPPASIAEYCRRSSRDEASPLQTCTSLENDASPPHFSPYRQDRSNSSRPAILPIIEHSILLPSPHHNILTSKTPLLPRGQKGKRLFPRKYPLERDEGKKFQCTWCNLGFEFPCDWRRHEKIHDPQERFTCMLHGERLIIQGNVKCPFCGLPDPTDDHLKSAHNTTACLQKKNQQRTFKRPEQLLCHMQTVHHATIKKPPESWIVAEHANETQNFWCGFCKDFLRTTWELRVVHIFDHFTRENLDMTKWVSEKEWIFEKDDVMPVSDDFVMRSEGFPSLVDPCSPMHLDSHFVDSYFDPDYLEESGTDKFN